jgi:hypothetical protein
MWFNSTISEEPYQGLTWHCKRTEMCDLRGCATGAAWLSSARVVRCTLKWGNERNPCRLLPCVRRDCPAQSPQDFKKEILALKFKIQNFLALKHLRFLGWEEGGDDVKSAWPLRPGLHTCYNGRYNGTPSRKAELIPPKPVSVRIEGCNSPS